MRDMKNEYNVLIRKRQGERPLEGYRSRWGGIILKFMLEKHCLRVWNNTTGSE
jgi:hypothetical protein